MGERWAGRLVVGVAGLLLTLVPDSSARPDEPTPEQRTELEGKARALSERAVALYRDGKYAEATELQRQALAMYRKHYPKERYPQGHPDLARSLNNLAFLHKSRGEYGKAEPLFREALQMRRGLYPK